MLMIFKKSYKIQFSPLCFYTCAYSIEQDQERGMDVRIVLVKDSPFDSDSTFSLSFYGQAASGVDFVLADTEEHDYIQLTAL